MLVAFVLARTLTGHGENTLNKAERTRTHTQTHTHSTLRGVNIWQSLLHPLWHNGTTRRLSLESPRRQCCVLASFSRDSLFQFQFCVSVFLCQLDSFFLFSCVCVCVCEIRVCNLMFFCLISFSCALHAGGWYQATWQGGVFWCPKHAYCWNYVAKDLDRRRAGTVVGEGREERERGGVTAMSVHLLSSRTRLESDSHSGQSA